MIEVLTIAVVLLAVQLVLCTLAIRQLQCNVRALRCARNDDGLQQCQRYATRVGDGPL